MKTNKNIKTLWPNILMKISPLGNRVYFISVVLLVIFSVAFGLYYIKNLLGIDLFPGKDMGRYFGL